MLKINSNTIDIKDKDTINAKPDRRETKPGGGNFAGALSNITY
tara:strand:- start:2362 stop:2490 length:129 start_codon:yes stop_codon:yes gene_type:complete